VDVLPVITNKNKQYAKNFESLFDGRTVAVHFYCMLFQRQKQLSWFKLTPLGTKSLSQNFEFSFSLLYFATFIHHPISLFLSFFLSRSLTLRYFFSVGALLPRSIIITEDTLVLCDEDYGRWPSSGIDVSELPRTPQFHKRSLHPISDIVNIVCFFCSLSFL
jgi:hypothetical protein